MKKLHISLFLLLAFVCNNAMASNYENFKNDLAVNFMQSSLSASIDDVTTHFDYYDENVGEYGMAFEVDIQISGAVNVPSMMIISFYYEDGGNLKDFNGDYTSGDGCACTTVNFTPPYQDTSYNDVYAFMPYSELHLGDDDYDLEFRVAIYAGGTQAAMDGPYAFTITQ